MDSAASLALEWWDRWLRQLILTEHAIISLLAGSKSFSSLHLMLVAYFTWHFLKLMDLATKRSILSNPAGWFFCPETLPESGDFFRCLRNPPPWSWQSRSRSLAPGFGLATLGSAQKVEGRGHRHCRVGMGWVGSLGRAKRAVFFFSPKKNNHPYLAPIIISTNGMKEQQGSLEPWLASWASYAKSLGPGFRFEMSRRGNHL